MRKLVVLLPLAGVLAAGCGGSTSAPNPNGKDVTPPGDIPDNQVFVRYRAPGTGFVVKVPEGWARRQEGAAVVFTSHLNSVAIEQRSARGVLTPAAARTQLVPLLARTVPGFRLVAINELRRPAGAAVHVVYEARSRPNAVTRKRTVETVERYVFYRQGRQAVLTLTGAKGADNVDPWRTVSSSLRWSK
jgi:hypothetical protein